MRGLLLLAILCASAGAAAQTPRTAAPALEAAPPAAPAAQTAAPAPGTAAPVATTAAPAFDPARRVLAPLEAPETGGRPPPTLEQTGDGYVYRSRPFDAYIRRDGTIHFDDHPLFDLDVPLIEALRLSLDSPRPDDPGGGVPGPFDEADRARLRTEDAGRDFRLDLPFVLPIPQIAVSFDAYEIFLAIVGEDAHPYQRLWILDQTEPLRNRLADESRAEDVTRAMRDLRPRMSRIWNDRNRPPRARRQDIFLAWDECEEGTPEGEAARDEIESFVRDRLPCESRDAYTEDELRELNARRESEERFDPYPDGR